MNDVRWAPCGHTAPLAVDSADDPIACPYCRIAELEAALRENVPHLGEMIRMPNIEHVADAHNKAVKQLRAILAKYKERGDA